MGESSAVANYRENSRLPISFPRDNGLDVVM